MLLNKVIFQAKLLPSSGMWLAARQRPSQLGLLTADFPLVDGGAKEYSPEYPATLCKLL